MKRFPDSFSTVSEAAFQCAQQLAESEIGRFFLANASNLVSASTKRLKVEEALKAELDRSIVLVDRKALDMVKAVLTTHKGLPNETVFRWILVSFFLGH